MNVFQDIIKATKSMDVNEKNEEQKLWNEKMKNAMSNFQGSLDFLELTSQHCYTIDERSKILIRDSEKLNVSFTSNEWDRISGRNEGNKTDNELWTKNNPLGRKMHVL
uniref:Uncharacterized protein n=1 Tax=Strongyloides venezuelensis TaxID=75913 RepID=A0A0K0F4F8_STRVS